MSDDSTIIDAMAVAICNSIRKDRGLAPIKSLEIVEAPDTYRRQAERALAAYMRVKFGK